MGRQTGIVATETDERLLLTFLRANADIQIVVSKAPTPEQFFVDALMPFDYLHRQYYSE